MSLELDDMLRLQSDIAEGLLSCDLFDPVHVVERRKKRLQSELDFVGFLTGTRQSASGKAGVALCVELPVFTVPDPNISGPQKLMNLAVTVLEHDSVNMSQAGSGVPAETWANLVLDFLHHWMPLQACAITADDTAIAPLSDFKTLVAYQVSVRLPRFRSGFTRVKPASLAVAVGLATVTNHADNPSAEVWWTKDGSYPADQNRVPASTATKYTAPFAVSVGDELRWAAYQTEMFPSNVGTHTVT